MPKSPISKRELDRQISEYEDGGLTRTSARDLASLYIVRDYLYPSASEESAAPTAPPMLARSYAGPDAVPDLGDSDFYRAIAGKDSASAWRVMADLMDTLSAVYAPLYNRALTDLRNIP